jgi:ankyrin repeat protein
VYDQAYEKVIERIESQPPEKSALARRVLSWITHAQRQLTIKELCHALAVVLDDEDLDEVDEDNIPDVEDIVSVCAGLVTIDEESNIIRLVHYTTQEYFERIREKWNPRAELEIASACLTYLSFHPFRSGSCPSDEEFESRLEHNAFLDYASRYWGQHARTVQEQVFEVASRFLQDDNLVSCAIQTMEISKYKYLHGYSQYFPRQVTSVHLAATFGLLYLLERLLLQPSGSIVISADSKDNYGLTPLSWAAWNGHEAVVKLLLEKGAQLESKDENGRTPLSWAAGNGHVTVVKLLVENGAQLESKDENGRTPLSYAAGNGNVTVVKLLVENGAQLESKDENGLPPLSYAAKRGHKAVVKLLVENGAHLESKDVNGQTPLSYASRSGHVTVVKLLVENGAQLESKDKYGWIPMWYAARNGHEAVVKLLLENDAQLESKDKNGQTPLSHDAGSRHEAVVKLLLENGADNS